MEEHIFLNEEDYKITNTRFIVEGDIFVIGQITSIKLGEEEKEVPVSSLAIGGVLLLLGAYLKIVRVEFSSVLIGLGCIFLLIAFFRWLFRKQELKVIIGFSSGEYKVVTETDRLLLERVAKALNDAIIFRG